MKTKWKRERGFFLYLMEGSARRCVELRMKSLWDIQVEVEPLTMLF